jgi:hypothetical protein
MELTRISEMTPQVDYLLHVYRRGSAPFRTLSVLPEEEALRLMRQLYVEGSIFWERFREPKGYLDFRKQVEQNLRMGFTAKGGKPVDPHPVYLVVGSPKWMESVADPKTLETTEIIRIPLSVVSEDQVSFTYPDSMVSALLAAEKNPEYYEPDYHGQVFTWTEMKGILGRNGLPGEGWETRMPKHFAHYIEAQVWNRKALVEYLDSNTGGKNGQLHV